MAVGTSERRIAIMRVLCQRRYDTVRNLAYEFSVSERTIMRDIEVLSVTEPIYTKRGKYGGGVYVVDDFYINRMYMTKQEITLLEKISNCIDHREICELDESENTLLKFIISQYKKPKRKEGTKNGKTRKNAI